MANEDKQRIKEKNSQVKAGGNTFESIEKMAQTYSRAVDFSGVGNLAALKDTVDAMSGVMSDYSLNALNRVCAEELSKGTMASANGVQLNVGKKLLRNPSAAYRICVDEYAEDAKQRIDYYKQLVNVSEGARKRAAQEALDKAKQQAEYKRHNVIYQGNEVESVIVHEMGHVVADQVFGQINGYRAVTKNKSNQDVLEIQRKVEECYTESMKNGDIKKISAYAAENAHEFFAECFTVYRMKKEKLPLNIEKMMKEVLK